MIFNISGNGSRGINVDQSCNSGDFFRKHSRTFVVYDIRRFSTDWTAEFDIKAEAGKKPVLTCELK